METNNQIVQSLDSLNQKVNFILSEVSGVKENLTAEDISILEKENIVLAEQVQNEEELLSFSTDSMDSEADSVLIEILAMKLVNGVYMKLGILDKANDEDFEDIANSAVLDEEDMSILLDRKDDVISYLRDNFDEHLEVILQEIEELTNEL